MRPRPVTSTPCSRRAAALAAAFALVAAAMLAACGGGLHTVEAGTLTACSDIPYEPFEFEKDGKLTGYDIDILEAVAKRLHQKLKVKKTPFDTILDAVNEKKCDVVASSLTVTKERGERVEFTRAYYTVAQSLLTKRGEAATELPAFAGKTIGVQSDTTGEQYAKSHMPEGVELKGYDSSDDLFAALEAGEIQAILQDFPVNAYKASNSSDTLLVVKVFFTGEELAFAVAKGNSELANALTKEINALEADGQLEALQEKYFGKRAL